jgi:hypothetical protein
VIGQSGFVYTFIENQEPGSSVGIATENGLDGPGIEFSGFGGLVVSMLASGTQDRGFAPDRSRRIFPAGKIHSMLSFGRGSKIICPMFLTRTSKGQKGQKLSKRSTMVKKIPGGRDFLHMSRPALGPTQPPVQWIPCLSRG